MVNFRTTVTNKGQFEADTIENRGSDDEAESQYSPRMDVEIAYPAIADVH